MDGENNIKGRRNGQFYLEYHSRINYAKALNGVKEVIACSLMNADEEDWNNVVLHLKGEHIREQLLQLGTIAANTNIQPDLDIAADEQVLLNLTETEQTTFTIRISVDGEEVFCQDYQVMLEPDDYYLHIDDGEAPKEITKQTIWERKLLDFSLRNNLINCKLGRRIIPFVSFGIDKLEDNLHAGEDYVIDPYPEKPILPTADGMYDSRQQASHLSEKVVEEIQKHRHLISYHSEKDLENALKFVFRASRNSLEENGANSLFLVLGMLKWFESERSTLARFAPVVLMPVDIIRKSGNNYVLRTRDEESIINTTLLELLKQQFAIDLSVLQPLPVDESGVDIIKILNTVRHAVKDMKRWQVMEEAELGLFSFNKFVMWNDLHNNAEKLKENVIVKSLMEGLVKLEDVDDVIDAREIDKTSQPKDFCIPIDVDSSQLEAVIESGRGKSFILYGPPGTGKSQTITNMIANALYQGKRVLFVAEKMAALEVVEKRLDKVGLAPFCLELHSNKVTKSYFLRQMQKALDVVHTKEPADYQQTSERLFAHRKELMTYIEALHRKQPSQMSLYDCITHCLSIKGEELKGSLPAPDKVTKADMARWTETIEGLDTVFRVAGHPTGHPLDGLYPKESSSAHLQLLMKAVDAYGKDYEEAERARQALPFVMEMADDDLEWVGKMTEALSHLPRRNAQEFVRLNADDLEDQWEIVGQKWFLPRFFAKRSFMKTVRQYVPTAVFDEVPQLLAHQREYIAQLKDFCLRHKADYDQTEQAIFQTMTSERLADMVKQRDKVNGRLDALLKLVDTKAKGERRLAEVYEKTSTWLSNEGRLKDWCLWVEKRQQLMNDGLVAVVEAFELHGKQPAEVRDALVKTLCHQQAMHIVEQDPMLAKFNGLIFEDLVEKYKQATYTFQDLSKKELYCSLAAKVPSQTLAATSNSEMGILKRNIANGGRGMSIRKIIDQIPTLLPKLCPCMLMSPISVAQYIDMDGEKFDLVIFDEASQMPTSEAIGAIARGKALICVGDPKQMPPTSFFTTQQVDEDEAEIDDMDSILDDCITLSMPGHYLSWHYRSKHESLIAFSNQQYYEGKLRTFPSTDDRKSKVRLVRVEGTYDKGHTRSNPAEAQAIVKEVIRRLEDPELRKFSIGIVSFSKVQQNLIEDILIDELAQRPELEQLTMNMEERIFVKNLENVQGDERDVILFSVGYGPDIDGRVSMNFGPLNNEGGERRLNVAVSRARYEMIVFATLRAEQIDMNRSKAKGVEGLKHFIEFADKGFFDAEQQLPLFQTESDEGGNDREMISLIADELRQHGYDVMTDVGRSQFKIDIAVVNPTNSDEYIMGILCDGRKYYDTKTVRDREIVQTGVLKGLSWNIMRVWTVDWYANRDKVVERILHRLEDIKNNIKPKADASEEAKKIAAKAFNVNDLKVEKTTEYQLPKAYQNKDIGLIPPSEIQKAVAYTVEQTVSIPKEELYRQAVRVLGFARRTTRSDAVIQHAIDYLEVMGRVVVSDNIVTLKS